MRSNNKLSPLAKRRGARNAGLLAGGVGAWPGQGPGERQVVQAGAEAIVGLPLHGDERGDGEMSVAVASGSQKHRTFGDNTDSPDDINTDVHSIPESPFTCTDLTDTKLGRNQQQRMDESILRQSTPPSTEPEKARQQQHSRPCGAVSHFMPDAEFSLVLSETSDELAATGGKAPAEGRYGAHVAAKLAGGGGEGVVHRHEPHTQWGGFGPGHVPKYFRGKFGVAGERKILIGRREGDAGIG